MYLFLGWRAMQDRIGHIGHFVEHCLWGDGRARHTFLMASTPEHPLVLIEIDVGDAKKGIRKSMQLNIVTLDEVPDNLEQVAYIGLAQSSTAFEDLLQSARDYVHKNPNYHALYNNCRTFVEYLIDQIPEFRDTLPRKKGSILEYYHYQAKCENPGALILSKRFLRKVRNHHHNHKKSKTVQPVMLEMQELGSNSSMASGSA